MRIHPLAHNPLQTHTSTQKPDTDDRERIGPYWVRAAVCDAGLARFPYGDGSSHGEKRLDGCAKRYPQRLLQPSLSPSRPTNAPKELCGSFSSLASARGSWYDARMR